VSDQHILSTGVAVLLFQARAVGLPEPAAEYRFLKGRRFRFDLAWPDHMVAVEVDGGAFTQGRHARGSGIRRDCEKFSEAAAEGWRVLRVLPEQVESGQALGWLERALGNER
jgi:hypothetical protein